MLNRLDKGLHLWRSPAGELCFCASLKRVGLSARSDVSCQNNIVIMEGCEKISKESLEKAEKHPLSQLFHLKSFDTGRLKLSFASFCRTLRE